MYPMFENVQLHASFFTRSRAHVYIRRIKKRIMTTFYTFSTNMYRSDFSIVRELLKFRGGGARIWSGTGVGNGMEN